MVRGAYKSRSKVRKRIRTPGGRLVVHYKNKNKQIRRCAKCKKAIKQRVSRPMQELCPKCLKEQIKLSVR